MSPADGGGTLAMGKNHNKAQQFRVPADGGGILAMNTKHNKPQQNQSRFRGIGGKPLF